MSTSSTMAAAPAISALSATDVAPDDYDRVLVALYVLDKLSHASWQPVTVGVPLPCGLVGPSDTLVLLDTTGTAVTLQIRALARWKDGTAKWLLLDFVLPPNGAGHDGSKETWHLVKRRRAFANHPPSSLRVREASDRVTVETGPATFQLNRRTLQPLDAVQFAGQDVLEASSIALHDRNGLVDVSSVHCCSVEENGPVRATVRFEGAFAGTVRCRFIARVSFFAGLGLVRLQFTLHNPERAQHPGGLWDLGDAGSVYFRALTLELRVRAGGATRTIWQAQLGRPRQCVDSGVVEIYQDSSGGDAWNSPNHVNREGRVPCQFRGYRQLASGQEETGLRASPVLALQTGTGAVTIAVPEFWQQFPKAVECDGRSLRVGLFPHQFGDLYELQGGEQKTHTVWLQFDAQAPPSDLPLTWVHAPARVHAPADWYASSGVLHPFAPASASVRTPLTELLEGAAAGPSSLTARREVVDEYGWRNFGEIYADHEAAYYQGPAPLVSHYNNQYDVVYGTLLHYLRTADPAWFDLGDPLARHVIDIDIYHTDRDKAAYNGGLFWFTDHYKTAATCTHRTYSRANCKLGDRSYGGGPSSAHNFTTGLLHYYFLTGDPNARAAVVGLADWVLAMDDGRRNPLGLLDDGPTGLASCTFALDYQGPGRGCGNSVNALLDAWIVTESRCYLESAERLIRRCIHPADDVASRNLLNVELRWSYTVFLSTLAKYLRLKLEHDELDAAYAYARASLLRYADWMVDNEVPYFDHPEKLEFPTEAWAAQELRKANVLRLAAAHADEPLRSRLRERGEALADRAWTDLLKFESRAVARALAIVMIEGLQDFSLRANQATVAARPGASSDFGTPETFVPQKRRIIAQARSPKGICQLLLRLMNPKVWLRYCRTRQA